MNLSVVKWLCDQAPPPPCQELGALDYRHWRQGLPQPLANSPLLASVQAGFYSDRLAWPYFTAYQQAIRLIYPQAQADTHYAFCVTEATGTRPKQLQTHIESVGEKCTISGKKKFVLAPQLIDRLLVVAVEEHNKEQPLLKMVDIQRNTAGVELTEPLPIPFVPEIEHCQLKLDSVQLSTGQLLPEDAYERYVKPMAVAEDLTITAAAMAYCFGIGKRYQWPQESLMALLSMLSSCEQIVEQSLDEPTMHLLLGHLLEQFRSWIKQHDEPISHIDAVELERWQRDKLVLQGNAKSRNKRVERAWNLLSSADQN